MHLLSSLRCLRRCNTIKFEAYAKQWHEIYFGILPAKVTGQHKLVLRSRAVALRCVNSIKSVPRISVLRRAYRAAFEYDTAAKARDAKSLKIFYEVVAGAIHLPFVAHRAHGGKENMKFDVDGSLSPIECV